MKKNFISSTLTTISFVALTAFSTLSLAEDSSVSDNKQVEKTDIQKGQDLAFARKKGNCLACHFVQDGALTGNTGPALIAMKARFPDREVLFNQVFDARIKNANTIMPPFGAHGALNKAEIDLIVTWLYTL